MKFTEDIVSSNEMLNTWLVGWMHWMLYLGWLEVGMAHGHGININSEFHSLYDVSSVFYCEVENLWLWSCDHVFTSPVECGYLLQVETAYK